MEKNPYIENMIAAADAWKAGRDERLAEISALKDANEWDKLVVLVAKEEMEHPYLYKESETALMEIYRASVRNGADVLEFDGNYWNCTMRELVECMRKYHVEKMVITGQDSSLMEDIWALHDVGCTFAGLKEVTRANLPGSDAREKGILIFLNKKEHSAEEEPEDKVYYFREGNQI